MSEKLKHFLQLAIEASEIAKVILSNNKFENQKIDSESGHDVKLVGDKTSETAIVEYLQSKTDFPFISEETGSIKGNNQNGFYWIVDPIDGSLNYARNIPLACISISLWKNDQPVLGVINDFNRDEVFTGIVGQGAWLNGTLIKVSQTEQIRKAILATGFPSKTDFSTQALSVFVKKVQEFKKIRLIGSASLSTAYVAAGRFDAYMEKGIMIWDVAAGIAITLAAGGSFQNIDTADKYQQDVIVCNKLLFNKLK